MTTYRSLRADAGIWGQGDPKAEGMYGMSPYSAMGGNPISQIDPEGDFPFLALGIGALVGVFSNGLSNISNGQEFFHGAVKAGIWGAVGAGASFGIGSVFGAAGSFGHELLRAGVHGLSSVIQSELQGGSFLQGALSGGISSGIGSGIDALGGDAGHQIFGGAIGGGIGAAISGGDFFQGFGQGFAVGAFNHALHSGLSGKGGDDPPSKNQLKEYLAEKFLNGTIDRQNYLYAITLVDDGSWGLIKQVIWDNKTDIALTVGGGGLFKILSKTRIIKDGILIGGKQFQLHKHSLSYLKGKGMSGTAKVWHINIGKKHIIFNPHYWGKLTSDWWNPIR